MRQFIIVLSLVSASAVHAQAPGKQTFVKDAAPLVADSVTHLLSERFTENGRVEARRWNKSARSCIGNAIAFIRSTPPVSVRSPSGATVSMLVPDEYAVSRTPIDPTITEGTWQQRVVQLRDTTEVESGSLSSASVYLGTLEGFPHVVLPKDARVGVPTECREKSLSVIRVDASYGSQRARTYVLAYGLVSDGVWWSFLGEAENAGNALTLESIARSIVVEY